MHRQQTSTLLFAALVILAGAVPHLMPLLEGSPLPASLSSLRLVQTVTGDEARVIVDGLHGKGVAQQRNSIGLYADDQSRAALYVTTYTTREGARGADRSMGESIGRGNRVFGHYRRVTVDGRDISMCYGMGQAHFFYSEGRFVYWLAVDMPVAYEALRALLNGGSQGTIRPG